MNPTMIQSEKYVKLPDVIVRETDSYHTYKKEAFKVEKYADSMQHQQREWFSIGAPKLIKRAAS